MIAKEQNGTLPFVVIFEGRTGSSELMARLNNHPKMEALPEILHPLCGDLGGSPNWEAIKVLLTGIARGEHVETYAESYSKQMDNQKPPVRGFKTRLNSEDDRWWYATHGVEVNFYALKAETLLGMAKELGYSLIYLHRQDLLRQSISWLRAAELSRRRKEWNILAGGQPFEALALDPNDVADTVEWLSESTKRHESAYDRYDGRKMMASYERLFGEEQEAAYTELLEFLGVESHATVSHYQKATPEDLSKAVSNWPEIERVLNSRLPNLPF